MTLSQRLRERRERMALTQAQTARALGVPRELISMWETGNRVPNRRQLEELAQLYRVNTVYLLAGDRLSRQYERAILDDDLPQDAKARHEIERWLDFLDTWAQCLEQWGQSLPGAQKPPRRLSEGLVITDARRAPTLAVKVREFYQLGLDALPNLDAFLDDQNVLVYRTQLGSIGEGSEGISGAFYNHPRLGYCILVNADTSLGRQTFTLGHEYAHALFHYQLGGLISRKGDRDARESFANAFAAHFLVPGKVLRRLAENDHGRNGLDPFQALRLAAYFRVSYATMLTRLREEKLIDATSFDEWRTYSPSAMAKSIGLDPDQFQIPMRHRLELERYPVSVLDRVKRAVAGEKLTPAQAARLLNINVEAVRVLSSKPPKATPEEEQELDELPF